MVNEIKTIYPSRLYKVFRSKFCVSTRVWHKTTEEDQRTYQPKRYAYNNEDDYASPNILSDKRLVNVLFVEIPLNTFLGKYIYPIFLNKI